MRHLRGSDMASREKVDEEWLSWLTFELAPVTQADPGVLAKYVLALVHELLNTKSLGPEASRRLVGQLDSFLDGHCESFVERLLARLDSTGYALAGRLDNSAQLRHPADEDTGRSDEDEDEPHRRDWTDSPPRRGRLLSAVEVRERSRSRSRSRERSREERGPPSWRPRDAGRPARGQAPPPMQWCPPPPARRDQGQPPAMPGRGEVPASRHGPAPAAAHRERALTTLRVSRIPSELWHPDRLRAFFSKFGRVADVRMGRRELADAFVQMGDAAAAAAALQSPEAVLGNRFVQLSWARYDLTRSEERSDERNGAQLASHSAQQPEAQQHGNARTADAARAEAATVVRAGEEVQKKAADRAAARHHADVKAAKLAEQALIGKRKLEALSQQMEAHKALLAEKLAASQAAKPALGAAPAKAAPHPLSALAARALSAARDATAAAEKLREQYEAALARKKRGAVPAEKPKGEHADPGETQ